MREKAGFPWVFPVVLIFTVLLLGLCGAGQAEELVLKPVKPVPEAIQHLLEVGQSGFKGQLFHTHSPFSQPGNESQPE